MRAIARHDCVIVRPPDAAARYALVEDTEPGRVHVVYTDGEADVVPPEWCVRDPASCYDSMAATLPTSHQQ